MVEPFSFLRIRLNKLSSTIKGGNFLKNPTTSLLKAYTEIPFSDRPRFSLMICITNFSSVGADVVGDLPNGKQTGRPFPRDLALADGQRPLLQEFPDVSLNYNHAYKL